MNRIIVFLLAVLFSTLTTVHAHSIWINAFESHAKWPQHAMVSLGWGHSLPMDDTLTSPSSRIAIERFDLFDPDLKQTGLIKPVLKLSEADVTTDNFDLFAADMGVQKVALKKNSAPGVYQFSAVSKPACYTKYIDKKGKSRMKLKPKDQLNDIQKVLASVQYQAFAKSYLTVGQWIPPKTLEHGLEILPRTDLSDLLVGDLVEVDVLFYGKPLSATTKSIEYITAHSSSFGQSDGFCLMSYIQNGRAQFRVQSAGQWMIEVKHINDVGEEGPLKDYYGKVEQIYYSASLTFQVR